MKNSKDNLSLTSNRRMRTYKLETKHQAGLRQFAKDEFMHIGLSQMEARILRVKLHQKLTLIISVSLTKGPGGKGKITSLSTVLRKEATKKKKPQISDSRSN